MESNPDIRSNHCRSQAAQHTTTTPLTSFSTSDTVLSRKDDNISKLTDGSFDSMFNNARNTYIAGGSFNITTYNAVNGPSPLDVLHKRVAPNAILNAGGRADEVRCHPGTRKEVISRLEGWRDSQDIQIPPIFWLSGPAGAGKSAIVQTIAERCKEHGVPQANFFFFRTDTSRNSLSPLVATLVHQIVLLYPPLRDLVAGVLSTNPLILDGVLRDQLMQLMVTPLQTVQQSSASYVPPLLLIDGLDECVSEEKRSQQQILQAFDKILVEYPSLFRLLVGSRDESQIQAAFNNISSRLLPLYLDDQYKPENDIRVFVVEEFKRILKTHPLACTHDTAWPSQEDVDGIVQKSSGQFIYAATIMRYLMTSSASPTLSLARVQGAAEIPAKTNSPFRYLDAIYTYILSQVDDQGTSKDILHARLLLQTYTSHTWNAALLNLLQAYNPKYSHTVVKSCLADLTPITRYTDDSQLLFHHASFPDYLLDSSRSEDHFVDLHAFNFQIQPRIWNAHHKLGRYSPPGFWNIALKGLRRLSQLPPDLLDAVLEGGAFNHGDFPGRHHTDAIKHLHSLCNSDDDVTKYKQITRNWINTCFQEIRTASWIGGSDAHWPPFARRYFAMTYIDNYLDAEVDDWNLDVLEFLRPETAADVCEISSWLTVVLHDVYRTYQRGPQYNQILRKWIFWGAQHNIPVDGVDDLPNAQWYRAMVNIERDITMDIALLREQDCDVHEASVWLTVLLRRIYTEKYCNSVQEYQQLLRKWTAWAAQNDIPLSGVDDLPNTRWYHAIANIERIVTIDIDLDWEKDCNVTETETWLTTLLHRIHDEKYHTNFPEYRRLVQKWVSWATSNEIPLTGADSLPQVQRYCAIAHVERHPRTEPHGWIDTALCPETDFDAHETALWLKELLHRLYREKHSESDREYNSLLQKWISWATWNKIPLDGVDDLPKVRWYLRRTRTEKWVTKHLGLGSRPE